MILLSWNCRGMGNLCAVRILGDLIKSHKPSLLFLSETLVTGESIAELCSKFGFSDYFAVDRVGQGGGLAVFWRNNFSCKIVNSSSNHIDVHVMERNLPAWRLTCFYGFSERAHRQESWDFLRNLAGQDQIPWCIFGDFNDMLYVTDKKGIHPHPQALFDGFRSAIEDCSLSEIDPTGGDFTWEKSKGTPNWVREKLDRAFATDTWWHKFPLCNLSVIHTTRFDHDPIKLDLAAFSFSRKQFRFRFENTSLKEQTFHEEVSTFWKDLPPTHLLPKLISVSSFMAKWGRNLFHKFREKVKKTERGFE